VGAAVSVAGGGTAVITGGKVGVAVGSAGVLVAGGEVGEVRLAVAVGVITAAGVLVPPDKVRLQALSTAENRSKNNQMGFIRIDKIPLTRSNTFSCEKHSGKQLYCIAK
jgi:hypothetical protein